MWNRFEGGSIPRVPIGISPDPRYIGYLDPVRCETGKSGTNPSAAIKISWDPLVSLSHYWYIKHGNIFECIEYVLI